MTTTIETGATAVADLAAKHTDAVEADRRLSAEVVAAVVDAGFARHFVPTRWGGDAGDFASSVRAVATVSAACTSTGWFASLTTALGRMCSYLPEAAQAELWADGCDEIVVGALMPVGRAEPVDGGWRLSGRWSYVSGIDHSARALVCGMAAVPDAAPQARFFLVPRAAYAVLDTWYAMGMRGTGSNTLVLDEVFVPASHSFSRDAISDGIAPHAEATCHRVPLRAANGLSFAAPVLGASEGALRSWTELAVAKKLTADAHHQVTYARAGAEIDAARLLLLRAATLLDEQPVGPVEVARNGRDSAFASDLLVTAVERLFRSAGTSVHADTHELQRLWRDVHAAASHVVLRFESVAPAHAAHAESVLQAARPPG